MTKREEWLRVAHTWIGVPWKRTGVRRDGVNCLGLLVGVARECSFDTNIEQKEQQANFAAPPTRGVMIRKAKEDLEMILVKDAVPGDLLILRINGQPQHIAIITDLKPLQFIHADTMRKVVRKSTVETGWHPVAAFKIRELYL